VRSDHNRCMNARIVFAAALMLLAALVLAQETKPKATLKFDKPTAVAGTTVKAKLILTFAEGLHGYQNPPTEDYQIPVEVTAAKGTTLGKVSYPKGKPFLMMGETKPSMVYEGTVEIPVEIKVQPRAGRQTVKVVVKYQQCTESNCFPPGQFEVTAVLNVTAAPRKGGN
jgi:DsbC/DsbD-like thiol-disulfide interchange protein